jgi:glycosyltransferase involved in cell wall biosynthesis
MPLVSVIIPTYNRARLVAGAVRSVLQQSYNDFEIIVVDDCGTDTTPAVIADFREPAIRYFRHDRRLGGAAARNTGIHHSTGEYIAFLDDDDEWYPEKLDRQVSAMLASSPAVGAVYTGYFVVDRSGGRERGQVVPTERGDLYEALLAGNCVGTASSMLLRRSCFDKTGIFDERLASFQDYDLWLRIARKYYFECIRQPLVKYFVHEGQIRTDSQALVQGLELMLRKYGDAASFRRRCAAYYLGLGIQYCENNRFDAGRKALLRAARLNPLDLEAYACLALSTLGAQGFRKARRAQATLLPRLRRREIHGLAANV